VINIPKADWSSVRNNSHALLGSGRRRKQAFIVRVVRQNFTEKPTTHPRCRDVWIWLRWCDKLFYNRFPTNPPTNRTSGVMRISRL